MSSAPRIKSSTLEAFFAFNPLLGSEDTEAKKLLFFHPPNVSLDKQKDLVGISEGLSVFASDYAPEKLCSSVHCNKQRFAFFKCEPDYWLVLIVNNPAIVSKNGKEETTEYLKDELEDAVLQAILLRCYRVFRLFNGSFQSIVDSHKDEQFIVDNHDMVRSKLAIYMSFFIPTVRFQQLPFFTDIHGFQFLSVDKTAFLTVQYLCNLTLANFPRIKQCALMYNSKLIWSSINQDDTFLLYNLDQESMYPFFTYLAFNQDAKPVASKRMPSVATLTPIDAKTPANKEKEASNASLTIRERLLGKSSSGKAADGKTGKQKKSPPMSDAGFLVGPMRTLNMGHPKERDARTFQAPRVYLYGQDTVPFAPTAERPDDSKQASLPLPDEQPGQQTKPKRRMICFRKFLISMFFILEDPVEPTPVVLSSDVQADKPKVPVFTPPVDFYNNLNAFLVAKFRKLSAMLNEQTERVHNTSSRLESKFRFLYFNHMNLALKTSLNSSTSPLSMEAIKIIRTMHADFATKSFKNKDVSHQDFGPDEVCVKTRNQGWIVGRKATQSHREFFVIVDEGAGNLADIKSEVDELARSYFYNIFIH